MINQSVEVFNMFESSNIEEISYSHPNSTLYVKFKGGAKYEYENVPENLFQSFKIAPSKGRFFHRNIKPFYNYTAKY